MFPTPLSSFWFSSALLMGVLRAVKERNEMFEIGVQRLETRSAETGSLLGVDSHDRQPAEAPHVDEAQLASGLELQTRRVCA